MVLEELWQLDRVKRVKNLTAESLGLEEESRLVAGFDKRSSLDEHFKERGRKAIEAVLEIEAEGVVRAKRVPKLQKDRINGCEHAVDGGIVSSSGRGAEGDNELGEEGGPGVGEVVGGDDR